MEETISIKAFCPVCHQDLSLVKVKDMGQGIFMCCYCGAPLEIKKLPEASGSQIDGRYVL